MRRIGAHGRRLVFLCALLLAASSATALSAGGPGKWSTTGSLNVPRALGAATTLVNGKGLVAGGCCDRLGARLPSAELYDPVTNTWTTTGSMASGRTNATLTALATGKALVAGGSTDPGNTTLASAELYDRVTGTWSSTGS